MLAQLAKPSPCVPEPAPWQLPVGWTLVGAGGAGLVVGGVLAGVAAGKRSGLEDACGEELACPPEAHEAADSYNALRVPTTVAFVAGGALVAGGVVLLVLSPSSPQTAQLSLGPGAVGVRGAW